MGAVGISCRSLFCMALISYILLGLGALCFILGFIVHFWPVLKRLSVKEPEKISDDYADKIPQGDGRDG